MTRWLRCTSLALAFAVFMPGGALHAQAPALTVPYTQFTLPNGLNVILHRDTSVPVVAVNVWYHVGSANERAGRTGFAHLFEHVMFEGSMHVPEGSFDVVVGAIGVRRSVVVRACGFQPRVKRAFRHVHGAFEHHVLEQVREAGAPDALVG